MKFISKPNSLTKFSIALRILLFLSLRTPQNSTKTSTTKLATLHRKGEWNTHNSRKSLNLLDYAKLRESLKKPLHNNLAN